MKLDVIILLIVSALSSLCVSKCDAENLSDYSNFLPKTLILEDFSSESHVQQDDSLIIRYPVRLYQPAPSGMTLMSDTNLYVKENGFIEMERVGADSAIARLLDADSNPVEASFVPYYSKKGPKKREFYPIVRWKYIDDAIFAYYFNKSGILTEAEFSASVTQSPSYWYFVVDGYVERPMTVVGAKVYRGAPWPEVTGNMDWDPSVGDYEPEHHKYIRYDGDDKYTLTMTVEGERENVSTLPKFDFVMIVDLSLSMDYSMGTSTRMKVLKNCMTATGGLIDAIYDSYTDANVAIVGFGGTAGHGGPRYTAELPYDDAIVITDWISNRSPNGKEQMKNVVNAIKTVPVNYSENSHGTNIQAGLMAAGEKITDSVSASRPDARKIVLLLTDGQPTTFYANGDDFLYDAYSGLRESKNRWGAEGMTYGHNGNDELHSADNKYGSYLEWVTDYDSSGNAVWIRSDSPNAQLIPSKRAWRQAEALGQHITDFYTIGFDIDDNYFLKGAREHTNLQNTAGFAAKTPTELTAILDSVVAATEIFQLKDATIEDALSEYVTIPEGNLQWNLAIDGAAVENTSEIVEYALYNPENHVVKARFMPNYILECDKRYEFNFNVYPSAKAFREYAENMKDGDVTGYGGSVGSDGSDAPGNATSSQQPGFYSNLPNGADTNVSLSYRFGSSGASLTKTPYVERPVVQVAELNIPVIKIWNDSLQDDSRPESISVTLYRVGEYDEALETVVLSSEDAADGSGDVWKHTFAHLQKKNSGEDASDIEYLVLEQPVDYYTTEYLHTDSGYVILNNAVLDDIISDCVISKRKTKKCDCPEMVCERFVDSRDGNEYEVVRVDGYCWMAENLRYATENSRIYRSYMHPDENENASVFGLLYTWNDILLQGSAAVDAASGHRQGVCPEGWHLPNDDEIQVLRTYLAEDLRAESHWVGEDNYNLSGLGILPGGFFNAAENRYEEMLGNAYFHGDSADNAFAVNYYCCSLNWGIASSGNAYSVRCVKNCKKEQIK